jgi:hypothetical protein
MAFRPRDLADRMASRRKPDDGYLRETFSLPRDKARTKARGELARTARRRHRIHHAAAAQRRLGFR